MINDLPISAHRQSLLEEQRRILLWLILTLAVVLFGWLWVSNLSDSTSVGLSRLLSVLVLLVCGLSYSLRERYFSLSATVFVGGLWIANAVTYEMFGASIFLYLFASLTLIACALLGRLPAVFIALLSSFLILANGPRTGADGAWAMILLWITAYTVIISFHVLNQALRNTWNYLDYTINRVDEAREHRAQLAQLNSTLKKAQVELQHSNSQLRHARYAAEEGRRLKAQFAANVSHELRTPINLIVGFSEMIVMAPEAYGPALPTAYRADMHAIYRNAKHLQSLINDVLDMSKIEAGQMSIIKEACDPAQIIKEAAALARDTIERKGLIFEVKLPPQMPFLWLDKTRIRQVILNLLSNANRFTDEGKISLSAEMITSTLRISVADTGLGIAESDLSSVFVEFHQLEGSLARRYEGSGLGLTLSKQFVELHGGRLWVESEGKPGKGSTFYVDLPVTSKAAAWQAPVQTVTRDETTSTNCFIVAERDSALISLFERYRRTGNFQPISVRDLAEISGVVSRTRPAALVINEASYSTDEIAQLVETPPDNIPIITCRMAVMPDDSSRLPNEQRGEEGRVAVLTHPISFHKLAETVERLETPIQNILVIAPERDVVQMYRRMLKRLSPGYEVWNAFSAREALAMMRKRRPDLLIVNETAAYNDSISLIEQIQSIPPLSSMPIIQVAAEEPMDAPMTDRLQADRLLQSEIVSNSQAQLSVLKSSALPPLVVMRCIEGLLDNLTPVPESTP
ncbi:MAG TPA: ATP-binding protein [Aggregatilineales bacterium]|nr:ATP-binding protein [Aggregatilineales bacterium]